MRSTALAVQDKRRVPANLPASHTPALALQRKCACGGAASSGAGEGLDSKKKKKSVQRSAASPSGPEMAPPIVHEVLRSSGRPLDGATRAELEPRFGHDFGRVRLHTDAKAAESARAVSAHAYTAGRDVVFGAGQYSPSTGAGRALLAQELTHVVQQGFRDASGDTHSEIGPTGDRYEQAADAAAASLGGPDNLTAGPMASEASLNRKHLLQRDPLTCFVQPVVDECNNATANCQTVAEKCKREFPKPDDLDNYIANLKNNFASSDFGPNAKRNFAHWLDGSGTEIEMPSAVFEAHAGTKKALLEQRDKFMEGAQKRLADGRMKPGVLSDVVPYTGHANSFSLFPTSPHSDDLAYAVGGFQLCSNVRMMATAADSATYNVAFQQWKSQAFDCYNWDPGKGIGNDMINDTKLCCVENAGKGKHFLDHSQIWENKDPASTQGFSVTKPSSGGSGGPGGDPPPAKPPEKKKDDDDRWIPAPGSNLDLATI